MARTGGRNLWIAVPAGLLCAAIVVALAYFAMPMVPLSVAWAGEVLRAATTPKDPGETPTPIAMAERPDCRDLFPDDLWIELVWSRDALLAQSIAVPDTMPPTLVEALTPTVLVTCVWRGTDGRQLVTSLARIPDETAPIAEASLRAEGFLCRKVAGGALICRQPSGDNLVQQVLRDGVWLSIAERGWHPPGFADRLTAHVWG
ncbi:hypothetical protein [Microbacterium sp.]|jgi:hypothetical protein|uniref:hypothetical protein n=1 Tax=Microbacterium sp. TaxID=51671 RepID=UPI002BE9A2DF|nr:hypothetical protein [Microbacterium sp.]HWL77023.1 hypothetical protein [Microbacterium sp.]